MSGWAGSMPRLLRIIQENGRTELREAGRLRPSALSAQINLLPMSHAEMTLEEDDLPVQMHDLVQLYGQNGSLGIFRVTYVAAACGRQRTVRLDHAISVLGDAVIPGEEALSGTVSQALGRILSAQAGTVYWRLGEVQDGGSYAAENRYGNALQCLSDLARQEEGYYFDFDFSDFPWTLRLLRRSDEVLSEFRLSRNVDSCRITLDDSSLCTRLYLAAENGEDDPVYETYDDTAAQEKWGVICASERIRTESVPDRAAWAREYLAKHAKPGLQIMIDGAELNRLTGERLDAVRLGGICRVALPEYGEVFLERILEVRYPDLLRQPDRVTVYMADKPADLAFTYDLLRRRTAAVESGTISNRKEIQKNTASWRATDRHVTDMGEILHAAGLEIDAHGVWLYATENGPDYALGASFKVQADAITAEVTRATAAESTMSTRITQTSEAITSEATRAQGAEQEAYTRIRQTADDISAVAGRVTTLEDDVESIEGTALYQNRNNIAAVAGKFTVDGSGNVVLQSGSMLKVTKDGVQSDVVGQTQLDPINNTLTTYGTRITQTETDIATKASQTDLDRTTGIVTEHTTAIQQNANAIALKASQSSVDSLGNRVTTAEATLTVQAGQISSKVSADGVISSINQSAEEVAISASRINLSGYVTASELQATNASITNLTSGVTTATALGAYNISAYTTLMVAGNAASWMYQSVVTSLNTTTVTIRDHDDDAVSFTALSPRTPTNTKTIYYLGRTPS